MRAGRFVRLLRYCLALARYVVAEIVALGAEALAVQADVSLTADIRRLFSAALAKELGPRGITVNAVWPGVTRTDDLVLPPEQVGYLVSQTPLGRLGEPADIADAVALLVSPDARWVSGQNLRVTGGML